MLRRIWIVMALALVLAAVLSACGGGDLAEDLTPIPTLPLGEEPSLAAPVQGSAPSAAEGETLSDDELIALGEETFAANCAFCHGAEDGTGPAFTGMATRAAERVEGMSAADYLHESIVDPGAYHVEGFGNMPPVAAQLSDTEIEGLVAYILDQSGAEAMAGAEETPSPTPEPEPTEEPKPTTEPEPTAVPEPTTESAPETGVDLELGETLFASNCAACHGETDGAGPALTGMGERAAERIGGMSAEDYLHESIVDPGTYVVEGFSDIMPTAYGSQFSDDEIASIVGYILAETGGEAANEAESTAEETGPSGAEEIAGDAEAGQQLFQTNCTACHGETDGVAPALTGMGGRAAERVDGMSAEDYLHESIVDPEAYVVDGYDDIMPKSFGDQFSAQDIADLIAYILEQ